MQVFDTLKLLMLLLGPSWLLLGRSGPKMAPKMGPQITFKSILKSLSQLAKIKKICVFEHLCYLLCFLCFWNTRPPKRALTQPRNLPSLIHGVMEPPRAFQKIVNCLTSFSLGNGPQINQTVVQKMLKQHDSNNRSCYCRPDAPSRGSLQDPWFFQNIQITPYPNNISSFVIMRS